MSFTDASSRISEIQSQIAALGSAFNPGAAAAAAQTAGGTAASTSSSSSTPTFASALAQAQGTVQTAADLSGSGGSTPLTPASQGMLTSGQQQFATRLAAQTGLSTPVISAWLLAEESGGAAQSRQSAGNNDWLNIGYTDSGTFGSADSVWQDPTTAADATAGWLKGQNTIPGYGTASSGIQAILSTAGQSSQTQIAALQHSGWASSGYPSLPALLAQVGG